MFYYFASLFGEYSTLFNFLRYISVRSIAALLTAFGLGMLLVPAFIRVVGAREWGQRIRELGPNTHQSKEGTPTMGGILILLVTILSSGLWARLNAVILLALLCLVLFGAIGMLDDLRKVWHKNTKGVSAWTKLLLQVIAAGIVLGLLYMQPAYHREKTFYLEGGSTLSADSLMVPLNEVDLRSIEKSILGDVHVVQSDGFTSMTWNLSQLGSSVEEISDRLENYMNSTPKTDFFWKFYLPGFRHAIWVWPPVLGFLFLLFVMVAFSNATNLSDGLDGLATGLSLVALTPFVAYAYVIGNVILSDYLLFPYIEGVGELVVFLSALGGALLAFLWYNVYPARLFMGDTGALAIGAVLAFISIVLKQEMLLPIVGLVFVAETVSVVLQVFSFKTWGKRLFRMTPLHHHFELAGWVETQVVTRFWIWALFCAALALLMLKVR